MVDNKWIGRWIRRALGIGLLLAVMPGVPAAAPSLAPDEGARLQRGEIVFRGEVPPRDGRQIGTGGTALVLIRAPAEEVWQILTDFEGYGGLFPRVRKSAVVEQRANRTLVQFDLQVGPFSFRFFVNNFARRREHLLWWRLDRQRENDLFQDTWGYWKLDPVRGGVLVTYAMGSVTHLPAFLTRGAERDGVIQTARALKARAEGIAGI